MDTDEMKAKLFCNGLNIQLQDHLVLFPDLGYNALASVAINQEGTFRACVEVEENKRKRAMPGPSGGGSGSAPPWDSRTELHRSSRAITRGTSSSTLMLLLHHSIREHSGHRSSLHVLDTHDSIVGNPTTSPRNVARSSRASH
jgi:hypothetical protein